MPIFQPTIFRQSVFRPKGVFGLNFADATFDWNFLLGNMPNNITFTRASAGRFWGSNGLLQSAGVNEPRFDYDPATLALRGLMIEGASTNQIINSEDFSNASWTKTATVTANTAVAPDGTSTADTLDDSSAVAVQNVNRAYAITSSSNSYAASVFLKANTSSVASVRVLISGVTPTSPELVVNLATGAAQWRTSFSGVSFTVQTLPNGWYRVIVIAADNASGNTSANLEIRPAFASTYSPTLDVAATGSVFAWGAQMEGVGTSSVTFASSYISTGAATATRAADSAINNTLSSIGFNASEGAIAVSASIIGWSQNFQTCVGLSSNSVSNGVYLRVRGDSGSLEWNIVDGGSVQAPLVVSSLPTVNVSFKTACAFQLNNFAASFNGGAPVTDAIGTMPASLDQMTIGLSATATRQWNGWIQRLTYYPTRLSDAQLQALTA